MLRTGRVNENRVLPVTITGRLSREEFLNWLPELEKLLEEYGTLRFYVDLEAFAGLEIEALWDDIKFDYKNKKHYGRTAVVGDRIWEKWGAKISDMFLDAEVSFFPPERRNQAWEWANRETANAPRS